MNEGSAAAQRVPGLDVLRAVAVVWVMLFHSWLVGGLGDRWQWLATPGWMGVDLFFVLSGYLIGTQVLAPIAAGGRMRFGDFYLRRAFRILPAFLVVLALYLAVPGFSEAARIAPPWMFLTFTANLFIDYAHQKAFSHAWSLCVEEHFYLLFPAFALLFSRGATLRRAVLLVLALVAAGMALRAAIWLHSLAPVQGVDDAARSFGTRYVEDIYYPTWNRLDGLVMGVALAALRLWRPAAWAWLERRSGLVAAVGLIVVAASIRLFDDRSALLPSIVGFPLLAFGLTLLVAAAASPGRGLSRFVPPGAAWLAAASYSLYLIHKPVIVWMDEHLPVAVQGEARFAVIAGATLAAGALLHHGVERPFLRLRGRVLARRARPSLEGVAASA